MPLSRLSTLSRRWRGPLSGRSRDRRKRPIAGQEPTDALDTEHLLEISTNPTALWNYLVERVAAASG